MVDLTRFDRKRLTLLGKSKIKEAIILLNGKGIKLIVEHGNVIHVLKKSSYKYREYILKIYQGWLSF